MPSSLVQRIRIFARRPFDRIPRGFKGPSYPLQAHEANLRLRQNVISDRCGCNAKIPMLSWPKPTPRRDMKRREFITLLGGSLAFARPAGAQASLPVIGFLNGGTMKAYVPFVEAWRLGLRQAGFVDGQNVTIQYRWTEGDPTRVRGYIEELVWLPSSVIVVSGGDA